MASAILLFFYPSDEVAPSEEGGEKGKGHMRKTLRTLTRVYRGHTI